MERYRKVSKSIKQTRYKEINELPCFFKKSLAMLVFPHDRSPNNIILKPLADSKLIKYFVCIYQKIT